MGFLGFDVFVSDSLLFWWFVCGLASGYVKVIIFSLCLFPGVMWNGKKRRSDVTFKLVC